MDQVRIIRVGFDSNNKQKWNIYAEMDDMSEIVCIRRAVYFETQQRGGGREWEKAHVGGIWVKVFRSLHSDLFC